MIETELLDQWASNTLWSRYLEFKTGGAGMCTSGENICASQFIASLQPHATQNDAEDEALVRAVERIKQAWQRASEQLIEDLKSEPNLAGHELGIHLGPDGPRMALILFSGTHDLETHDHH